MVLPFGKHYYKQNYNLNEEKKTYGNQGKHPVATK